MSPQMGKLYIAGTKLYAVCPNCGKLVCLNKRWFGSLHLCVDNP